MEEDNISMMGSRNFRVILVCLFVICFFKSASSVDITYVLKTEGGDSVVNVTVSLYNESLDLVGSNVTNDLGNFSFTVENSSAFFVYGVIPSSNYHAVIGSVSASDKVFLNDVLGGSIRLINTLGQPLEAQDCSVVVLDNETNNVVKDYHTLCYAGEPYVDPVSGNWVSYSKCPFTDSNGNYYFNTIIKEEEGYQAGKYYLLQFTCNAKTNSSMFYVDVPKPTDVGMWFEWVRRYAGILIVYLALFIAVIILIYLIKRGIS